MDLITVPAKDLRLHDILGEGQDIWCIIRGTTGVVVWWSDGTGSLASRKNWQTDETKRVFREDELVKVVRVADSDPPNV